MKKICALFTLLLIVGQGTAQAAQEAPAPRPSPRTPVNRQALETRKPAIAPQSTVQGLAYVIDSEKLHVGDIDVRLFGVVPPQLSASYGPQARAALDKLVAGQPINCLIRDRDQAGRFLATCRTASNTDLAIELLRRGLAVTARGSLASTELAQPYLAAEQAAETQKTGLWSGVIPAPVVISAPVAAAPAAPAPVAVMPPPAPPAAVVVDTKKDEKSAKVDTKPTADAVEAKVPAIPLAASTLTPSSDEDDALAVPQASTSFFARYQILFTGLIMLLTALGIFGVVSHQRRQEKRDELKAIAAALRGELTAARGVCLTRAKAITNEAEDKATQWPRIRATLYQAYVGRLGWLGAELSRQVASIYGQASDYAAYYSSDEESKKDAMPKRQALQTLVHHIEEVLPKLAQVEQTGRRTSGTTHFTPIAPIVEKSITTAAPVTSEGAAASEVTHPVTSASHPIWDTMRKFARERFVEETPQPQASAEDNDYAALIEEEMANLTFGEAEDDHPPANVTKIRPTGS